MQITRATRHWLCKSPTKSRLSNIEDIYYFYVLPVCCSAHYCLSNAQYSCNKWIKLSSNYYFSAVASSMPIPSVDHFHSNSSSSSKNNAEFQWFVIRDDNEKWKAHDVEWPVNSMFNSVRVLINSIPSILCTRSFRMTEKWSSSIWIENCEI